MSKKRYENIKLNGVDFIFDNKELLPLPINFKYRSIYDAYETPSIYKIDIWRDWEKWFYENDGYCGINSKNCMQFSITGVVRDSNTGKRYRCEITKAYNRCYEMA